VRFHEAIDLYVEDMWAIGRMSSAASERAYRDVLTWHAEDSQLRDPRQTTRDDEKRTLRRWKHPNTIAARRSILVSFYDWLVEEGHRPDNPARATPRPRKRKASVYRMTIDETRAFLEAAAGTVERRAAYLGVGAGLRAQELRGLQGRHFEREGWIWISADIAKGPKERWVRVIKDLEGVVAEIRRNVGPNEYVIPVTRGTIVGGQRVERTTTDTPASYQVIWRLVKRIKERAHIAARVTPHTMRHAFADHIARQAGMREAQALLGHADIATTQGYVGDVTLDELAASVDHVRIFEDEGGPPADVLELQQYRHGDSNPGSRYVP
jgi:integrase/recombinase XerD